MSDDQDGCEWVSVSSGTGLPGLSRTKAVKQLCVCVCPGNNGNTAWHKVWPVVTSVA